MIIMIIIIIIIIIIITTTMFMALSSWGFMTKDIARVQPVHSMNAD